MALRHHSKKNHTTPLAVFCSGNGTNLQAIIDAIKAKKLKRARIALVVADNDQARALQRARKAHIETLTVFPHSFSSKSEYERYLVSHLKKAGIQFIVLAGFMRILGRDLLRAYPNRIVNIHPALLPSFKGAHGIQDAFRYGVKVTGVTVHFVDERVDHGPIIMQEMVPIQKSDTLVSLEKKIHKVEHALYYRALQLLVDNKIEVAHGKASFR